jgi:hypothetical protein
LSNQARLAAVSGYFPLQEKNVKKIDTDRIPADVFDKMKAAAENRPEPIDNSELVMRFRAEGGNILHFRPQFPDSRGLTVAFKAKSGRIEIATALTHRNDGFTKKIGTKTAIQHFDNKQTVFLPLHGRPVDALKFAFAHLA